MSTIQIIKDKITENNLNLDVDIVLKAIEELKTDNISDDKLYLFYTYILNLVGDIISKVADDKIVEILGWLKIKNTIYKDKSMYFYRFETDDDYSLWLIKRKEIYSKLDDYKEIRILNFLELSTFDFISDVDSNCRYRVYNKLEKITIQKAGMVCTKDNSKFNKTLANYFKENFIFKPI